MFTMPPANPEDPGYNSPMTKTQAICEAFSRGRSAGRAAGSWVVDGNTKAETARYILRGIEDGDPEVMDMQPSALSGENAGESIEELLGDLLTRRTPTTQEAIMNEYETAFQSAYWDEVQTSCLNSLGIYTSRQTDG